MSAPISFPPVLSSDCDTSSLKPVRLRVVFLLTQLIVTGSLAHPVASQRERSFSRHFGQRCSLQLELQEIPRRVEENVQSVAASTHHAWLQSSMTAAVLGQSNKLRAWSQLSCSPTQRARSHMPRRNNGFKLVFG